MTTQEMINALRKMLFDIQSLEERLTRLQAELKKYQKGAA